MEEAIRMSVSGPRHKRKKSVRKPPPQWRKYLTQAELELPAPAAGAQPMPDGTDSTAGDEYGEDDFELQWWQQPRFVAGLGLACALLLLLGAMALLQASRDRQAAATAAEREKVLTLRAINSVRAVRIPPNPRSWSATPDFTLAWPEPPQLLELHLPVGYAAHVNFAVIIDKVDHGRVLVVERLAPDSNKELLLSVNSSAFGPGEYRLRLQGYTWRGERVDVGWVRLLVTDPRR
jgi:hypothetical protein